MDPEDIAKAPGSPLGTKLVDYVPLQQVFSDETASSLLEVFSKELSSSPLQPVFSNSSSLSSPAAQLSDAQKCSRDELLTPSTQATPPSLFIKQNADGREQNHLECSSGFSTSLLRKDCNPLLDVKLDAILLKIQDPLSLSNEAAEERTTVIIGELHQFCSEREMIEKQQTSTANDFERLNVAGGDKNVRMVNRFLAFKAFQRSDASKKFKVEDIRPVVVCRRAVHAILAFFVDADIFKKSYLYERENNEEYTYLDVHNFLRDRLRAVWQDLTVQRCSKHRGYIESLEISCRFLIFGEERLCELSESEFDPVQNHSLIVTCLDKLMAGYNDVRCFIQRNECAELKARYPELFSILVYQSPYEAEFWAYKIILNLDHSSNLLDSMRGIPSNIRCDVRVMFALMVHDAFRARNARRYFSLMKRASYLLGVLMNKHSMRMRIRYLIALVGSCAKMNKSIGLDVLCAQLGFEMNGGNTYENFFEEVGIVCLPESVGDGSLLADLGHVSLSHLQGLSLSRFPRIGYSRNPCLEKKWNSSGLSRQAVLDLGFVDAHRATNMLSGGLYIQSSSFDDIFLPELPKAFVLRHLSEREKPRVCSRPGETPSPALGVFRNLLHQKISTVDSNGEDFAQNVKLKGGFSPSLPVFGGEQNPSLSKADEGNFLQFPASKPRSLETTDSASWKVAHTSSNCLSPQENFFSSAGGSMRKMFDGGVASSSIPGEKLLGEAREGGSSEVKDKLLVISSGVAPAIASCSEDSSKEARRIPEGIRFATQSTVSSQLFSGINAGTASSSNLLKVRDLREMTATSGGVSEDDVWRDFAEKTEKSDEKCANLPPGTPIEKHLNLPAETPPFLNTLQSWPTETRSFLTSNEKSADLPFSQFSGEKNSFSALGSASLQPTTLSTPINLPNNEEMISQKKPAIFAQPISRENAYIIPADRGMATSIIAGESGVTAQLNKQLEEKPLFSVQKTGEFKAISASSLDAKPFPAFSSSPSSSSSPQIEVFSCEKEKLQPLKSDKKSSKLPIQHAQKVGSAYFQRGGIGPPSQDAVFYSSNNEKVMQNALVPAAEAENLPEEGGFKSSFSADYSEPSSVFPAQNLGKGGMIEGTLSFAGVKLSNAANSWNVGGNQRTPKRKITDFSKNVLPGPSSDEEADQRRFTDCKKAASQDTVESLDFVKLRTFNRRLSPFTVKKIKRATSSNEEIKSSTKVQESYSFPALKSISAVDDFSPRVDLNGIVHSMLYHRLILETAALAREDSKFAPKPVSTRLSSLIQMSEKSCSFSQVLLGFFWKLVVFNSSVLLFDEASEGNLSATCAADLLSIDRSLLGASKFQAGGLNSPCEYAFRGNSGGFMHNAAGIITDNAALTQDDENLKKAFFKIGREKSPMGEHKVFYSGIFKEEGNLFSPASACEEGSFHRLDMVQDHLCSLLMDCLIYNSNKAALQKNEVSSAFSKKIYGNMFLSKVLGGNDDCNAMRNPGAKLEAISAAGLVYIFPSTSLNLEPLMNKNDFLSARTSYPDVGPSVKRRFYSPTSYKLGGFKNSHSSSISSTVVEKNSTLPGNHHVRVDSFSELLHGDDEKVSGHSIVLENPEIFAPNNLKKPQFMRPSENFAQLQAAGEGGFIPQFHPHYYTMDYPASKNDQRRSEDAFSSSDYQNQCKNYDTIPLNCCVHFVGIENCVSIDAQQEEVLLTNSGTSLAGVHHLSEYYEETEATEAHDYEVVEQRVPACGMMWPQVADGVSAVCYVLPFAIGDYSVMEIAGYRGGKVSLPHDGWVSAGGTLLSSSKSSGELPFSEDFCTARAWRLMLCGLVRFLKGLNPQSKTFSIRTEKGNDVAPPSKPTVVFYAMVVPAHLARDIQILNQFSEEELLSFDSHTHQVEGGSLDANRILFGANSSYRRVNRKYESYQDSNLYDGQDEIACLHFLDSGVESIESPLVKSLHLADLHCYLQDESARLNELIKARLINTAAAMEIFEDLPFLQQLFEDLVIQCVGFYFKPPTYALSQGLESELLGEIPNEVDCTTFKPRSLGRPPAMIDLGIPNSRRKVVRTELDVQAEHAIANMQVIAYHFGLSLALRRVLLAMTPNDEIEKAGFVPLEKSCKLTPYRMNRVFCNNLRKAFKQLRIANLETKSLQEPGIASIMSNTMGESLHHDPRFLQGDSLDQRNNSISYFSHDECIDLSWLNSRYCNALRATISLVTMESQKVIRWILPSLEWVSFAERNEISYSFLNKLNDLPFYGGSDIFDSRADYPLSPGNNSLERKNAAEYWSSLLWNLANTGLSSPQFYPAGNAHIGQESRALSLQSILPPVMPHPENMTIGTCLRALPTSSWDPETFVCALNEMLRCVDKIIEEKDNYKLPKSALREDKSLFSLFCNHFSGWLDSCMAQYHGPWDMQFPASLWAKIEAVFLRLVLDALLPAWFESQDLSTERLRNVTTLPQKIAVGELGIASWNKGDNSLLPSSSDERLLESDAECQFSNRVENLSRRRVRGLLRVSDDLFALETRRGAKNAGTPHNFWRRVAQRILVYPWNSKVTFNSGSGEYLTLDQDETNSSIYLYKYSTMSLLDYSNFCLAHKDGTTPSSGVSREFSGETVVPQSLVHQATADKVTELESKLSSIRTIQKSKDANFELLKSQLSRI